MGSVRTGNLKGVIVSSCFSKKAFIHRSGSGQWKEWNAEFTLWIGLFFSGSGWKSFRIKGSKSFIRLITFDFAGDSSFSSLSNLSSLSPFPSHLVFSPDSKMSRDPGERGIGGRLLPKDTLEFSSWKLSWRPRFGVSINESWELFSLWI